MRYWILLLFLGLGLSGGAAGARHGACLMAGGSEDAYRLALLRTSRRPISRADAAMVPGSVTPAPGRSTRSASFQAATGRRPITMG